MDGPTPLALSQDQKVLLALRSMRSRIEKLESAGREPIAVIGIGCRFPGGASGPGGYWRLLREGRSGIGDFPPGRWDMDALFSTDRSAPGKVYTRRGGFVEDVDRFDARFFGISPREASSIDPQQRLFLQVAWEALEHAGVAPDALAGSATSVFAGICSDEYTHLKLRNHQDAEVDVYDLTGNALNFTAGRLSYVLGLQGPAMAIDSACSSSLVAVHLACQSLRSGESTLALAGGVSLMLSPDTFVAECKGNFLSPDGLVKTFDARADGYARGEGCGVVVLKRLTDAQASGDDILALIRGTAVGHDGHSSGLTVPNGLAQEKVIRKALENAGVQPAQVGYVEAHGTGTALGDPIEVEALRAVLGEGRGPEKPLVLGAVKTNLGHLEAAAGIAGLIKVVLSLRHREIPPNLNFTGVNPRVPLDRIPAVVPQQRMAWPEVERRIAGVSSFGVSGTNAHAVLEEAPAPAAPARPAEASAGEPSSGPPMLVPLSARDPEALKDLVLACVATFEGAPEGGGPPPRLLDIGYTAARRRAHHPRRLAVVAGARQEWVEKLKGWLGAKSQRSDLAATRQEGAGSEGILEGEVDAGRERFVAFIFPGQGSQWVGMGRELMAAEPVFREELERAAGAVAPHVDFSLLEELGSDTGRLARGEIDVIQPALFAVDVALAALWRHRGIQPDAVVGHSWGEAAAAYVAGALSLEDAARVVCHRSRLLKRVSGKGAMVLVGLSEEATRRALVGLEDRIWVSVSNSPGSTGLSGEPEALQHLVERLREKQISCQPVKADVASHSPHVDPLLEELEQALSGLQPRAGTVPLCSTVTGLMTDGADLDARYWASNLRQPVQFSRALEVLIAEGKNVFVEVSPHPILLRSVEETLAHSKREGTVVASLRRGQGELRALLESSGRLYTVGLPLAWERLYPAYPADAAGGRRVDLPAYPWRKERLWFEAGDAASAAGGERRAVRLAGSGHPLLQGHLALARSGEHAWEMRIGTGVLPYLADHQVQGTVVLPATAYLEMALAAARQVFGPGSHVEEVALKSALIFTAGEERELQLLLTPELSGTASFQIATLAPGGGPSAAWEVNATGLIRSAAAGPSDAGPPSAPLEEIRGRCPDSLSSEAVYRLLEERGLCYGPSFRGVEQAWRGEGEVLARLRHTEGVAADTGGYHLHPAFLDAAFQAAGVASSGAVRIEAGDAFLPVAVGSLRIHGLPRDVAWSHVRVHGLDEAEDHLVADFTLLDEAGRGVVEIRGLRSRRLGRQAPQAGTEQVDGWLYEIGWQLQPRANSAGTARTPGGWLLLERGTPAEQELRARLEASGQVCHAVVPGNGYRVLGERRYQLSPGSPGDFRRLLKDAFPEGGLPCRGLLHLWSLDTPAEVESLAELEAAQDRGCLSALHLTQAAVEAGWRDLPRLWLVTRGTCAPTGRSSAVNAAQAPLVGLARVINHEHPALGCTCVDLDPSAPDGELRALCDELWEERREEEIALREDGRYVARLVRAPGGGAPGAPGQRELIPARPGRDGFRLEGASSGSLDDLGLRQASRLEPGAGQVEIQVVAAGLNFSDVMKAMGIYATAPGAPVVLGGECAGRISRVGPEVVGLAVGDEVVAIAPFCFGSFATTYAALVARKPERMGFEEAATLPLAFLTAHFALVHCGRISRGERILIHAASGGVGLAAVQIARSLGAEVLATAGSEEKRAWLRSQGIDAVMDSRSLAFAEEVMRITGGRGVDLILNSLAGAAIARGLSILAPGGRFLEIGRRDIYENSRVGLLPFRNNLALHAIDLDLLSRTQPDRVGAMLRDLMRQFQEGVLEPLPRQIFPLSQAPEAFRLMARARHIGKIVLTLAEPEVRVAPDPDAPPVRPDASYLVTGGLGGLGLEVARWMVTVGARHVTLVGRRSPSDAAREAIREMEARGARITVAQADIGDADQVARVARELAERGVPLRGVVHAAGALEDGLITKLSRDSFMQVMRAKVFGTWLLHRRFAREPLDFFVLFSSAASVMGPPGQGNHAAANAFMDALAHARRGAGQAATSINWGPWSEVGVAAGEGRFALRGLGSITTRQGLEALGLLLRRRAIQTAVMPLNVRQWRQLFPAASHSPRFEKLLAEVDGAAGVRREVAELRQELKALEAGPKRRARLEGHVCQEIARVLRMDASGLGPRSALGNLGFDSLMALEVRNRLESSLGLTLPATLIWSHSTVEALASGLATRMDLSLEPEEAPAGAGQEEQSQGVADLVEQFGKLSEGELKALLEEEPQP